MNRPDGQAETLGIDILDEPCLNSEDKTVLQMKYLNSNTISNAQEDINVDSIELADKNPKEISRWISNVQGLHETKPLPTVSYSKNMPEMDKLMEEWPSEVEQMLGQINFPGPEIDLHPSDYARLVCNFMDIPTHKLANQRSVIESLH
jgi:intraflagellar transport protein 46